MNIADSVTNYGEREIVPSRSAAIMKNMLEKNWIYKHGAPKYFSADPEFTRPVLLKFLSTHGIETKVRPSRCSHKNGKIERSNGLFKAILERISKENTVASPHILVARASFMSNMLMVVQL